MSGFIATEEEKLFRSVVRKFAKDNLVPRAQHADEMEEFSWDNWRGMASIGLTGIGVSSELGGSGGGYRHTVIAEEEIARGDASTSVTLVAHLSLALATIYTYGNREQISQHVPDLAKGNKIGGWALTESGSGSDAASLATTATLRDNIYYLNGTKTFISNGDIADKLVVFAREDHLDGDKGISVFIVEKGTPGFQSYSQKGKLGMRGSTTAELTFDNVAVPAINRIGKQGEGFKCAMGILDTSRIVIAAQCVGIAKAAFYSTLDFVSQRRSFGKPIGQHQAIQSMLADMASEIYVCETAVMHSASLKDNNLPFSNEASMVKLISSEMCNRVTANALQMHGGYGYFKDSPVERYFRDARVTTIYEGTSQIQRLIIARNFLNNVGT